MRFPANLRKWFQLIGGFSVVMYVTMVYLYQNRSFVSLSQVGLLARDNSISARAVTTEVLPFVPKMECIDPTGQAFDRVEDIYCLKQPKFLPQYKNPCFYEEMINSTSKTLRCLPYFYIIGMDKCGTSDMHSRIALHKDVRKNCGTMQKEAMFWSWYRYGIHNQKPTKKRYFKNYLDCFSTITNDLSTNQSNPNVIAGDATPMDLWDHRFWPLVPQNKDKPEPAVLTPHFIRHIYQDFIPRFLIQLREPVQRLYSDYIFLFYGKNPTTFHHHVEKGLDILNQCIKEKGDRWCLYSKEIYHKLPVRIHLGCYSVFIKEWLGVFPKSSFQVTRVEDYKTNMEQFMNTTFQFLHLDPMGSSEIDKLLHKEKVYVTKHKSGVIHPATFKLLKDFYEPYLRETVELLGDNKFLWEDVYSGIDLSESVVKQSQEALVPKKETIAMPVKRGDVKRTFSNVLVTRQ